jgi:hypothetical protein
MELSEDQIVAILEGYGCDYEETEKIVQEIRKGDWRSLERKMLTE